jgi:hypothetical protein
MRQMKKALFSLFAAMLLIAFSASAVQAEGTFSGKVEFAAYSARLSSTTGSIKYDGWLTQQSLILKYADEDWAVYGKVWNSKSWDGEGNGGDETDLKIGVTKNFGLLTVGAGYAYWIIPGPVDYHDIFVEVKYRVARRTSVYAVLDNVMSTDPAASPSGMLWKAGVNQGVYIAGQIINLQAQVGGHDDIFGLEPDALKVATFTVSTDIPVDPFVISPVFAQQISLGDCDDASYVGVKLALPFELKK